MADLLDLIVLGFDQFIKWYANEVLGEFKIIDFFVKELIIYIITQLLLYLFPVLRKLMNIIYLPFRWIHVYLHVYSARLILNEIKELKDNRELEDYDPSLDSCTLRSSLISGVDVPDENPGLLMAFNRSDYARRVAFAPRIFGLIMLVTFLIITPLAFTEGQILSSTYGAYIHFYLCLGIFGVMMPSLNDFYFVLHSFMISSLNVRPIWIYISVIVYLVVIFDSIWRFHDFSFSIFLATISFLIYLIGLFITAFLAQGGKIRNSKIFYVPIKNVKELIQTDPTDIQFLALEDLDI
ncbi:MAG: hypothetical protein ACFFAU_00335 [Candidatus Hodarchaeota archaeon]